jgi:uncharacterized phage-associated protein
MFERDTHDFRHVGDPEPPYAQPMGVPAAVPAAAVATALRARLPGLTIKKLHKLLYYCQGHHLAVFGSPLFTETISAWDMGPVVGQLWYAEHHAAPAAGGGVDPGQSGGRSAGDDVCSDLSQGRRAPEEAELNTVGYVVSRYGALTGRDLEHLTHSETPWRTADAGRPRGQSARIELSWLAEYFRGDGDDSDDLDVTLHTGAVRAWLRDAEGRRQEPVRRDTRDELLARLSRSA